jgi:hypothetical protein
LSQHTDILRQVSDLQTTQPKKECKLQEKVATVMKAQDPDDVYRQFRLLILVPQMSVLHPAEAFPRESYLVA